MFVFGYLRHALCFVKGVGFTYLLICLFSFCGLRLWYIASVLRVVWMGGVIL